MLSDGAESALNAGGAGGGGITVGSEKPGDGRGVCQ